MKSLSRHKLYYTFTILLTIFLLTQNAVSLAQVSIPPMDGDPRLLKKLNNTVSPFDVKETTKKELPSSKNNLTNKPALNAAKEKTEAPKQEETESDGAVNIKISANSSNSIFLGRKISYSVTIENTHKDAQEGTVILKVLTDKNKGLFNIINTVNIKRRSSKTITNKFTVPEPGFYELVTYINLSDYEDTIRNVFGYKPEKIMTPMYFPKDFDNFWYKAKQELKSIAPNYKIYFDSSKSTKTHKVYLVEMMSLEHTKISGWLTIPRISGLYPVLLGLPGYQVILKPRYGEDYISFQLNIRKDKSLGEELEDGEYEYTLYNIKDPKKYIYRGAYMDCIRALDFITSHAALGIDTTKIIVDGGSQGATLALVTSALDNRVSACIADNPVYCDTRTQVEIAAKYKPKVGWPLNRYKEYIYKHKNQIPLKNILATMDYFDPQNFMPYINCPVLIGIGLLDQLAPPSCVYSAYNKLNEKVKRKSELYVFNTLSHEVTYHHSMYKYLWTLEKFVDNRKNNW